MASEALIVVDLQNDFCPGGALGVAGGDEIVPIINRLVHDFEHVILTQDWHPAHHSSFASSHPGKNPFETVQMAYGPQTLWPDHCVQGTRDADFHPDLDASGIDFVQRKGTDPAVDSYSAFRDNDQTAITGLSGYLSKRGVDQLDVCGLATDYCVSASAIDAATMLPGTRIRFIEDASRGIDASTVAAAREKMLAAGIEIITSSAVLDAA